MEVIIQEDYYYSLEMSPRRPLHVIFHELWMDRLKDCCRHCGEINDNEINENTESTTVLSSQDVNLESSQNVNIDGLQDLSIEGSTDVNLVGSTDANIQNPNTIYDNEVVSDLDNFRRYI